MSARKRTLDHLQKLFAVSAAAVATSVAGCEKDRGYGVVDPMPAPPPRCFDPLKTVKATVKPTDGAGHMFAVRLDLLPEVKGISFEKAEAKAAGWKKSGEKVDVKYKVIDRAADHIVIDVEVPPPDVNVTINLRGLVCEIEYAKAIAVTLTPNGAIPAVEIEGAVYDYEY